jgi:hypothetical protein
MITNEERLFMAGLLAGISMAWRQVSQGEAEALKRFHDDLHQTAENAPDEELDTALWARMGAYRPAREALLVIFSGGARDRAISQTVNQPDRDAAGNVWNPLVRAQQQLVRMSAALSSTQTTDQAKSS